MQKLSIGVLALGACSFLAVSCAPAQAQNSVTLRKGDLQPAGWHKSRPIIQIIDERPEVHDLRRPDAAPEQYVIPIGPVGSAPGNSVGGGSVRMVRSGLPQSGFGQSNIPSRPIANNLPSTRMGGLSPVDKVRPMGLNNPIANKLVSAHATPPAAVAASTYPSNYRSQPALTGSGGGTRKISTDVVGAVRSLKEGK